MRVFIAIDLPIITKEELGLIKLEHKRFIRYPSVNLHLTLKFIGEVTADQLEQIEDQLRTVKFSPFTLTFSSLGYFYPHRRGTPVWIGVKRNENLISLQMKVEERLKNLDLKLDKMKYTPHLTLGRMERGISEDEVKEFIQGQQVPDFSITVDEFTLFHSHSTKNGVEYLPLKTIS